MPARKEDEIMAEYLLKGGKMLEKTCRTCGCPLFEVKGRTLCVVCAENEPANDTKNAKGAKKPAVPPAQGTGRGNSKGSTNTSGEEPKEKSYIYDDGGLAKELESTIHTLCERIRNEKDASHVLTLMNAVKAGTEALDILCRL